MNKPTSFMPGKLYKTIINVGIYSNLKCEGNYLKIMPKNEIILVLKHDVKITRKIYETHEVHFLNKDTMFYIKGVKLDSYQKYYFKELC